MIYERYEHPGATFPIDGPFLLVRQFEGLVALKAEDNLALLLITKADFKRYFRPKK